MPRTNIEVTGSEALGLSEDLEGVETVKQGASRFDGVVIDFTDPPKVMIEAGTECDLQIKQARPGATKRGFPKASIMYVVQSGIYEGEAFWDDLLFIPPQPPKKGTMWRVRQFCAAINYELPSGMAGDEIVEWMQQFCEDILGDELHAEIDINYSTEINPKTGKVYDPRNQISEFIAPGTRSIDDLLLG